MITRQINELLTYCFCCRIQIIDEKTIIEILLLAIHFIQIFRLHVSSKLPTHENKKQEKSLTKKFL